MFRLFAKNSTWHIKRWNWEFWYIWNLSLKTEQSIFNEHKSYYDKVNIKYAEEFRKLPYIYWTSKMHKKPPKQRFITCDTSTSLEGISKVIILCLKRLFQYVKSGAEYCNAYKPYNTFFIVDNREEVINFLTTSNFRRNCGGANSVRVYDFSNIYTSIPHQKLKRTRIWFQ